MKFAIINDAHLGPLASGFKSGIQRKLTGECERLLKGFVMDMNEVEYPEFVVNLGDSIEDINDHDQDIIYFKRFLSIISSLDCPLYHLVGNHDVRTIPQEEIAIMLGYEKMYYSFDSGAYHFVALSFEKTENPNMDLAAIGAHIPPEQLAWLAHDLSHTSKPTLIFEHYGLAEDDLKGNFWFEKEPHRALISNRAEVRKVLEGSSVVKAVISAHQHWNRMHVHNGIPYFTITSLVENTHNDGIPAGAYTIVELNDEKIMVTVRGNDPIKYEYAIPKPIESN